MAQQQSNPVESALLFSASGAEGHGLFLARWNAAYGTVSKPRQVAMLVEPVFLARGAHASAQCVYAVSEGVGPTATVSAFRANADGSALHALNVEPANGDGTTHISVAPDGRAAAVANYTSGSVSTFRIGPGGMLSPAVCTLQNAGRGHDAQRQASAHAHSARYTLDGRFLLLNDLGADRIFVYRVDPATAMLAPHTPPYWQGRSGSGPRHLALHPNGRWVYSVNELDSTVDILAWDPHNGVLITAGFVSTLPNGFPAGTAFAGEIAISDDGETLYVGNRVGSDTIAVFRIADGGRTLTLVQLAGNAGRNTRYLVPDSTSRWLLLCNYGSGDIVTLRRDARSGELSDATVRTELAGVTCCVFL